MKTIAVAIVMITLAGCVNCSHDDALKKDLTVNPNATSVLAGEDKIRPSCEEEMPGDWSAIAFCVKTQTRGFQEVHQFLKEHNIRDGDTTPEAKIFANCNREYSYGHPDWSAIAFCVKTQWAGYRELNP